MNEIETGFEALTSLVRRGWQLTDACLIENGRQVDLPMNAFDTSPMEPEIRQLKAEWERLLGEDKK